MRTDKRKRKHRVVLMPQRMFDLWPVLIGNNFTLKKAEPWEVEFDRSMSSGAEREKEKHLPGKLTWVAVKVQMLLLIIQSNFTRFSHPTFRFARCGIQTASPSNSLTLAGCRLLLVGTCPRVYGIAYCMAHTVCSMLHSSINS